MITPAGRSGKAGVNRVKLYPMDWIYLSPHMDDAALSCGGLIWEQTSPGSTPSGGLQVAVWTICAGDPPGSVYSPFAESLHARWETGSQAAAARRQEDLRSCQRLGAIPRHFSIPDAIYRLSPLDGSPLYDSPEALFGAISPLENKLIADLRHELAEALQPEAELVCPLGIGGHVDHRLVRQTVEGLGRRVWYYADFPYVVWLGLAPDRAGDDLIRDRGAPGSDSGRAVESVLFPISEAGLEAWVESVAAHASQISSLWPGLEEMEAALRSYCREVGGIRLWRR